MTLPVLVVSKDFHPPRPNKKSLDRERADITNCLELAIIGDNEKIEMTRGIIRIGRID